MRLHPHQLDAVNKLHKGSVLCGGVGSGKSLTAIAYYYKSNGGNLNTDPYEPLNKPKDLYIITTAKKRDDMEWDKELRAFMFFRNKEFDIHGVNIIVDSWNNIKRYKNIYGAFFIFDEQRIVGKGVWVKTFIKLAKRNNWILLSATPGANWIDYVPLFVANGFFVNRKHFEDEHCVFARYVNYPKLERYYNTSILEQYRARILVDMPVDRHTIRHNIDVPVEYDYELYRHINKTRWNVYKDLPIENASEYCYTLRKVVNSTQDRLNKYIELINKHDKIIVFYNYDYELELLKNISYDRPIAEWNGHKHEKIPVSSRWVYLVQYNAGCEGWNCIETNVIVYYSTHYSYKVTEQVAGRIDRLNTPFIDLYYYHLISVSPIDVSIRRNNRQGKKFSERAFARKNHVI